MVLKNKLQQTMIQPPLREDLLVKENNTIERDVSRQPCQREDTPDSTESNLTNSPMAQTESEDESGSVVLEMEPRCVIKNLSGGLKKGIQGRLSCPPEIDSVTKMNKMHKALINVPSLFEEFYSRKKSLMEQEAAAELRWQDGIATLKEVLKNLADEEDGFNIIRFQHAIKQKVSMSLFILLFN